MDVLEIPFNHRSGIKKSNKKKYTNKMAFSPKHINHVRYSKQAKTRLFTAASIKNLTEIQNNLKIKNRL